MSSVLKLSSGHFWSCIALVALISFAPFKATAKPDATEPKVTNKRIKVDVPKQVRVYREHASPDSQEKARKIFHMANQRFEQRRVDEAIKLYYKAYTLWPHPRILFNIAVSLGFLSQPLESAQTFKKVLEYGPEPISPERYKQALERYIELMGQLAQLRVICKEAGTKVFVDGKSVGIAPLNTLVTIGPGTHLVTASLKGKVPYTAQVRLEPGTRARVEIQLQEFTDVVQYRMVDRYHWAVPVAVTATTAALLATGLGLLLKGRMDVSDLQEHVDRTIANQGTSRTFTYNTGMEDRAVTMQIAGQALMGVAAAAAVASVVLWLVRKKRVRHTETGKPATTGTKVEVRF